MLTTCCYFDCTSKLIGCLRFPPFPWTGSGPSCWLWFFVLRLTCMWFWFGLDGECFDWLAACYRRSLPSSASSSSLLLVMTGLMALVRGYFFYWFCWFLQGLTANYSNQSQYVDPGRGAKCASSGVNQSVKAFCSRITLCFYPPEFSLPNRAPHDAQILIQHICWSRKS